MKKITDFLFSMLFTGILVVIFAIAIGYATFIENDYGTVTAKILIYNSKWFEILLVIICINLVGSVFRHNLFSRKRWPGFLFHISFIVIIIGAGITRYYGYEGMMHIREGEATDYIVSDATYVTVEVTDGNQAIVEEHEVRFSPYTANRFSEEVSLNGKTVEVTNLHYMPSAAESVVADPAGEPVVSVMAVGDQTGRMDFNLKNNEIKTLDDRTIGFNTSPDKTSLSLILEESRLFVISNDSISRIGMNGETESVIAPGTKEEINTQKIYGSGKIKFVVKQYLQKGKIQLAYNQPQEGTQYPDAMQTRITSGGSATDLIVYGQKGTIGEKYTASVNGLNVSLSYGSKRISLPFSIYLNDFQLERYPGSNSPSSYASEVTVKDGSTEMPFRIFMNNILKYQGFRFFQSSYDNDERGTVLSVNYDSLGTGVTYFGYLLMAIGMVLTLFNKNSRFLSLLRVSAKLREERKKLFAILIPFMLFIVPLQAQTTSQTEKTHVAEFEKLIIQSYKGRIEPVSTLASEILRKVAKKNQWEQMTASEVFMDMQANPEKWKNISMIRVGNPELRRILGTNEKYISFNQVVMPREMGGYRLSQLVSAAYAKSNTQRNKLDKEVINVDERVNILMNVFNGDFLTIFPVPGDDNHKWVSVNNLEDLAAQEADFVRQTFSGYLNSVKAKDWATAGQILSLIKQNQEKHGTRIMPSKSKIKMEVLYNKLNIFGKLSKIFMFTGLILLFIQLLTLFNPAIRLRGIKKVAFIFILLLFLAETAGLTIRWYISGHAPWSNGYESMVFISWATCLAGIIFANRSEITLSLTTVLTGLTLMVAGMSWMSPEITNLVPVLKSYWLIVHVAIITASYGFLGIGALLGLLNLVLMIFRNRNNQLRVNFTIKELVNIIHITLIIGLIMLIMGSFIGGVWANESWGRYWGWDPKETWALVTVLVYTFVAHMHKIPGFRGSFAVSAAALVSFGSVLMTFFGVNYYLSGLHSYAQGEPAPIPKGVYVAVILIFMLIFAASVTEKHWKDKSISEN